MLALDEEGIGMGSFDTPGLNARVISLIAEASRDLSCYQNSIDQME